ncbi:Protein terminal ear1 [Quillaja saponaria]|uniref:Protein terminal ear1 n=1 Tax=Quillaja saponaria TaxID=32244 RepID=A0AAD7LYW5_QUISA|nr:Protein terminal ear1 [Quillaja saponaria]
MRCLIFTTIQLRSQLRAIMFPSSEIKNEILKELEGSDNSGSEENEKTVKGFNSIVSVPWKQRCSPRKKKRVSTSKKNLIKKEWKLKNIPFPSTEEEAKRLCTCTVMIKNIPNQFRRNDLMRELDSFCFEENKISPDDSKEGRCQYDLVYLPMDFWYHVTEQRITNLGYAFVNFTSPTAAFRCYKRFNGLKWDVNENKKICEITSAQVQGKEALKKKFCSKIFKTHSPDFLPFELFPPRDGLISEAQTQIISIGKHEFGLPPKRIQRRCACLPLGRN